jgi:uncharacterized protein with LGFP repeats
MAVSSLRVAVVVALVASLLLVLPAGAAEPVPTTRIASIAGLTASDVAGLSAPVAAPVPFSLLGFSLPHGATLEVRTSPDGTAWGPWEEMERLGDDAGGPDPDGAEDAGAAAALAGRDDWRNHTEPLWVGPSRWFQVRLDGAELGDVRVHLIDTLGIDRSLLERAVDRFRSAAALLPERARAQVAAPHIVPRHEWGADEGWRRAEPSFAADLRGIVVHHTAGSNTYSREEAPAVVRAIYAYHARSLGWNDIGYNLLIDRFGTIYEGRAGGVDRAVIGAHTGGFNSETTVVGVMGTHTVDAAPEEALESTVQVIAWKAAIHGLDPLTWTTLHSRGSARHPRGQHVEVPVVSGHRTLAPTACPGDALYSRMQDLREAASERMRDPQQHEQDEEPLLRRLLGSP